MNFCLKILGSVLIIISSTVAGFSLAKGLELRKQFIISFLDFLYNLQINIRYFSDDIFTLINKSVANKNLDFFFLNSSDNFIEYWDKSIENIPTSYRLSKEEYTLLEDFGAVLGVTDVEGQLQHIELYKKLFETQLKKAENQQKNKSKLYKVMGFFIGAITVLVII